jgi:alpha-ribazole phosphatase
MIAKSQGPGNSSMIHDNFSTNYEQEIYLVRHGHLQKDPVRRYVGQTDYPLSPLGIEQAQHLRDIFSNITFKRIVSSDLKRTMMTAEIIAQRRQAKVTPNPAFREIKLGAWEGRRIDEIMSTQPEEYAQRGLDIAGHCPPEGESFYDLSHRVIPAFQQTIHDGDGPLLIVTHVGVIRVILCHVLEIPLRNIFALYHDYGAYTLLKNDEGQIRLVHYNLS